LPEAVCRKMYARFEALHGTLPSTHVGSGMRISVGTYGKVCAAAGEARRSVLAQRRRVVEIVILGIVCAGRQLRVIVGVIAVSLKLR